MDKEEIEIANHTILNEINRIKSEINSIKSEKANLVQQQKELDVLIKENINKMRELSRDLKENLEKYFENKPYEAIETFIKERGYSYSVSDVIKDYASYKEGYYVSYSMNDCIKNLQKYLEEIYLKSI